METYFLCIETSGSVCSAALCGHDGMIEQKISFEKNSHSKYLTVFLKELLETKEDILHNIEAVAVSSGPGSYTGLRIGVSAAKGFAYALDIPIITVGTLDIMVNKFLTIHPSVKKEINYLVPMIDARRSEVYTAVFDLKERQIIPVTNMILHTDSFKKYLDKGKVAFFGDGSKKFQNMLNNKNAMFFEDIFPEARFIYTKALKKYIEKDFANLAYFEPFYLKPFISTTKAKDLINQHK